MFNPLGAITGLAFWIKSLGLSVFANLYIFAKKLQNEQ
jgi:hypothetical protein